jgi:hypothetical protein
MALGVEKYREILAHRAVSETCHLLRGGSNDDVIVVLDGQPQQLVSN